MFRFVVISVCCIGCISFEIFKQGTKTGRACALTEAACDGIDDDCNGEIDEGITRDCSTCVAAGTEQCRNGAFSGCTAPALEAESCNGIDDDCDGEIDEDLMRPCSTSCGSGVETCVVGVFAGCTAPPAPAETCNNMDDNCDGQVDEGVTRACTTCRGSGIETCAAGVFSGCTAPQPIAEVCNGLDDDCVAGIDNGFSIGTACDSGDADTCARGTLQCSGLASTMCVGDTPDPVFNFCLACNAGVMPGGVRVGAAQFGVSSPAAVWNGSEWGLAWSTANPGEVYFSRAAANGVPIASSEVKLSSSPSVDSKAPEIAWNGVNYAVTWMEEPSPTAQVLIRLVDVIGTPVGAAIDISSQGASGATTRNWFPKIVTHPVSGNWMIYWECGPTSGSEPVDICLRTLTPTLSSATPAVNLDAPKLVSATGTQRDISLAPAFVDGPDPDSLPDTWVLGITFRTDAIIYGCVTGSGWDTCTPVQISNAPNGTAQAPSIVWNGAVTGAAFRVFWMDDRNPPNHNELYTDTLSIANVVGDAGADTHLNFGGGASAYMRATWDGSAFLAAWEDPRDGNDEIYVGRVSNAGIAVSQARLTNTSAPSWRPSVHFGSDHALVGWQENYTEGLYVKGLRCAP